MSTEQPVANVNGTPTEPPFTGELNAMLMRSCIVTIKHEQGEIKLNLGILNKNEYQRHVLIQSLRQIKIANPDSALAQTIVDGVFKAAGVTEQD